MPVIFSKSPFFTPSHYLILLRPSPPTRALTSNERFVLATIGYILPTSRSSYSSKTIRQYLIITPTNSKITAKIMMYHQTISFHSLAALLLLLLLGISSTSFHGCSVAVAATTSSSTTTRHLSEKKKNWIAGADNGAKEEGGQEQQADSAMTASNGRQLKKPWKQMSRKQRLNSCRGKCYAKKKKTARRCRGRRKCSAPGNAFKERKACKNSCKEFARKKRETTECVDRCKRLYGPDTRPEIAGIDNNGPPLITGPPQCFSLLRDPAKCNKNGDSSTLPAEYEYFPNGCRAKNHYNGDQSFVDRNCILCKRDVPQQWVECDLPAGSELLSKYPSQCEAEQSGFFNCTEIDDPGIAPSD